MKASRFAGIGAAATVTLLAGCASGPVAPTREVDVQYVNYVEQSARKYGTQVIWVNLPTRPVAAAQPAVEPQKK